MGRRLISCCMALLMLGCALAEDELDITYRFGSREEQKIAVTIDDCYHAEDVRAVLDILQANDVRATFFPIGKALKYEDAALWQEVVASGCEIGNHSWGHTYLTKLSRQKIKFQMLRTQEKVDAAKEKVGKFKNSMLNSFPSATSNKFGEALDEFKEYFNRKK